MVNVHPNLRRLSFRVSILSVDRSVIAQQALMTNTGLTRLNFAANGLTEKHGKLLGDLLQALPNLTRFNVRANSLGSGLDHVHAALAGHPSITKLTTRSNGSFSEHILQDAIRKNWTLIKLDANCNQDTKNLLTENLIQERKIRLSEVWSPNNHPKKDKAFQECVRLLLTLNQTAECGSTWGMLSPELYFIIFEIMWIRQQFPERSLLR